MPRPAVERPWSDYRLGMAVVASGLLLGLTIFIMGSAAGPLRPETVDYLVDLDDAAGIRVGSLVRVGGIIAGEVTGIEIVPPPHDPGLARLGPGDTLPSIATLSRSEPDVRLTLSVEEAYADNITPSSRAQLAILGAGAERYVKITAGDVREAPIEPGSTIPTVPSVDWDLVLGRLARAFNETEEIIALTDEIKAKLAGEQGSVGRLMDPEAALFRQVAALQAESKSLFHILERGPGFVGLYRRDRELQNRLDRVRANVDALRAELDDPQGSLRSWARRDELDAAIAGLQGELDGLDASLQDGRGSLGRLLNDQEIYIELRVLQTRVREVVEAFKANPLRFVNIRIF